jgi:hypothetical protein
LLACATAHRHAQWLVTESRCADTRIKQHQAPLLMLLAPNSQQLELRSSTSTAALHTALMICRIALKT